MCWDKNRPPGGLPSGPISATSPPTVQACRPREIDKIGPLASLNRPFRAKMTGFVRIRFRKIPNQLASWPGSRIRAILKFRTIGSRGPLELPFSLGMLSPPFLDEPE